MLQCHGIKMHQFQTASMLCNDEVGWHRQQKDFAPVQQLPCCANNRQKGGRMSMIIVVSLKGQIRRVFERKFFSGVRHLVSCQESQR